MHFFQDNNDKFMKFFFISLYAISIVFSQSKIIYQDPVDLKTQSIFVQKINLSNLKIEKFFKGEMLQIAFSAEKLEISSKSFKEFKNLASKTFPKDYFKISKNKNGLSIICINEYNFTTPSNFVPHLLLDHINSQNDVELVYSRVKGVQLVSGLKMLFSNNIIANPNDLIIQDSLIVQIPKIDHRITIAEIKLSSSNQKKILIPSPFLSVVSSNDFGVDDFKITLRLDNNQLSWNSYIPSKNENYVIDKNILKITLPPNLFSKKLDFNFGELFINGSEFEGVIPLSAIISRNQWEKSIDLSKKIEMGKIDLVVERPAIVHSSYSNNLNRSLLRLNLGSQLSLVNEGDAFKLTLIDPKSTGIRFDSKLITSSSDFYKFNVINSNTCEIILLQKMSPNSSIEIKELPIKIVNNQNLSGLSVQYPKSLRPDETIDSFAVIPEIKTLFYEKDKIILPKINLSKYSDNKPLSISILNENNPPVILQSKKAASEIFSNEYELAGEQIKSQQKFHIDYLFKYQNKFYAQRKVIYTGSIDLKHSETQLSKRLINTGSKPQKLSGIKIIDDNNILQNNDSIFFSLPENIKISFVSENSGNQNLSVNKKLVGFRFEEIRDKELRLPDIELGNQSASTFALEARLKSKFWEKKILLKDEYVVGSPNISLLTTNPLVLYKQKNYVPIISISDPDKFLNKTDTIKFDFFFDDGSAVNQLLIDSKNINLKIDKFLPNRIIMPIKDSFSYNDTIQIDNIIVGTVTKKNDRVYARISLGQFSNTIIDKLNVLLTVEPSIDFNLRNDDLWVSNDIGVKDIISIELIDNDSISAFISDLSYVDLILPAISGAKWNKNALISDLNLKNKPSFINDDQVRRIHFSNKDIADNRLSLGEYEIISNKIIGSRFNFEYVFEDHIKNKKTEKFYNFYKPKLLIKKDKNETSRKDIYVHQSDSIRIALPLISYIEESNSLLDIGDKISLKWSSQDWNWSKTGKYDTEKLTLLSKGQDSNELIFELKSNLKKGQSLRFTNFEILYSGRTVARKDSLIASISKNVNDYIISSTAKIISASHELEIIPHEQIWSRDNISTPVIKIRGSPNSILSKNRNTIIRLRSDSKKNPHWKSGYSYNDNVYSATVNSKDPSELLIKFKNNENLFSRSLEVNIPNILLDNVASDLGDIYGEFSFDGGENFAERKILSHIVRPKELSTLTSWKLMNSSLPQPLNRINIVNGDRFNSFYAGDTLSVLISNQYSIQFSNKIKNSIIVSGMAKEKFGIPILSKNKRSINFPILSALELDEELIIDGLYVQLNKPTKSNKFKLNYKIIAKESSKNIQYAFTDRNEISISTLSKNSNKKLYVYSLLDSVFQIPRFSLSDDQELPFFEKGDRLIFKFNKPLGYNLLIKNKEFRNNDYYDIEIRRNKDIHLIIKESLNAEKITLDKIFLNKPSDPMGFHSLQCEVIKSESFSNSKSFVFNMPLQIAFSNDFPSFYMQDNVEFLVRNKSAPLPTLTIREDSLLQTIKKGNIISINLPADLNAAWSQKSINNLRLSGRGSKKIESIKFVNSKFLSIRITNDFITNEKLVIDGLEIVNVIDIMKNPRFPVLTLSNNQSQIKNIKPGLGAKGKISAGEIKLVWGRNQMIVPETRNDSKLLDQLRVVRDSNEQLDYFNIKTLYLALEPISGSQGAVEWENKIRNFGEFKFQHEILSLNKFNKNLIELKIKESDLAFERLAYNEISITGLWLGEFKNGRNGEYKLSLKISKNGPTIATSNQKIVVDWNGIPPQPFEYPFDKNKIVRLSGIGENEFVETINTKIINNNQKINNSVDPFRNNSINLTLAESIERGTKAKVEKISIKLNQANQTTLSILPKIEINTGYGFESFPAYNEMIVDFKKDTVTTRMKRGKKKSSENIKDIFIDEVYLDEDLLVFNLEFEVEDSELNPEIVNINNRRNEIFKELFPIGQPDQINDITTDFISSNQFDELIKKTNNISNSRWQKYYLSSLINHFAGNDEATKLYKKAGDLGYSIKDYDLWPQNPHRDSDQNIVEGRLKKVIELTKVIPNEFFYERRTDELLGESDLKKLEQADDIFLRVQEIDNWQDYAKSNSNNPNREFELFFAEVDLAMGLGDLTKASEKLKELKRTRTGRQIRRKMKNKNEKLYSSKINIRENKIKWEEENKITIPKSDYNDKTYISNKRNAFSVALIDKTDEEIKFRVVSPNHKKYENKGEKFRTNQTDHTFYGQGIYMIDPEIEKDKKNINVLNIIFSTLIISMMVLL